MNDFYFFVILLFQHAFLYVNLVPNKCRGRKLSETTSSDEFYTEFVFVDL